MKLILLNKKKLEKFKLKLKKKNQMVKRYLWVIM